MNPRNRFAQIRFPQGTRLMPADSPYDRQLLFEEAELCARRYGHARIEIERDMLHVQRAAAGAHLFCAGCAQQPAVTFAIGTRRWCQRCAQQVLHTTPLVADAASPELATRIGPLTVRRRRPWAVATNA